MPPHRLPDASPRAPLGDPGPAEPIEPTEPTASTRVLLHEPSGGVPEIVDTPAGLEAAVESLAAAAGPVAADAERASGYRYGQRTYLVQLRRRGSGTTVIDPIALPDLSAVSAALQGAEWVFHAASQDLPGLRDQGLLPDAVFDTELAARLLGMERVGLAAVVAETLGLGLAKEHSAVDWSTRPLPREWIRYAALDVEVLLDVRDLLAERLRAAGKEEWARQEFEAVRTAPAPGPRAEPWRRTSGLHAVRTARGMAVVQALWEARDADARSRDIAPGRVLPDAALVAAGVALPGSAAELAELKSFSGKATRRRASFWFAAVERGLRVPEGQLPSPRTPRSDGPPPARAWADRDPQAAARLAVARQAVLQIAAQWSVPVENLLQPDLLRRLCWSPPAPADTKSVTEFLVACGARPWQVDLTAAPLADALASVI
jgi:ribonuclease D